MIKTEKLLRVRNQLGRTVRVVREHYLRDDVPCLSAVCPTQCDNEFGKHGVLPEDVTHYIVPDSTVANDYLEILEFPELRGIIFMQTVANSIQYEGGRRAHNRLKNIVRDLRRSCVLFHNEYHKDVYCSRQAGETLHKWHSRSAYHGALWYFHHLQEKLPMVMITEDKEFIAEYGTKQINVFVMCMEDYLNTFWAQLTAAHELRESLAMSLEVKKEAGSDYIGYQSTEVLEAGLKSGRYIQGCLQVNKHNAQQEAFVRREGIGVKDSEMDSDILISGMAARNRAVHGDTVVVELLPKTQWKGRSIAIRESEEGDGDNNDTSTKTMPTGVIIGIVQKNRRDYVASFAQEEDSVGQQRKGGKCLVIPYDYRIPKIRISTRQAEILRDQRIVVRIDSWPSDSQYPNGHFVRAIGEIGDLETEIETILVENSISVGAFSETQTKELPTNSPENPWKMENDEIALRRDLRDSHLIFSIDPKGCEDVDDTLSVRTLPNGNIELGVHIADVSFFVQPNSHNDLEAASRSTTVYLADRRYDMLPAILSADLCSLIGGVDRYAMSVIWELTPDYEVVDVWYGRTVIKSAYKLFYEIAQAIVDGASQKDIVDNVPELQELTEETAEKRISELKSAISALMDIARTLRSRRTLSGGLELEGVEVQVQLDNKKKIEDLIPKQPLEIHETIAECMIFANHWVAKKISETFPNQALLRHHPLPRQEHFDQLSNCAKAKGFDIDTHSNKALAESLDRCVDQKDPVVNKLLRTLATLAMSNAMYFSTGSISQDQYFHYGLALDKYTHFTSPIRRYADIIVHRLLLAALGVNDTTHLRSNKELEECVQHINRKHRAAQNAQRDSQELFQYLYFRDRPVDDDCCVVDAVIFQLRANGLLVFIPRYGMKGPVYLRSKDGQVAYITRQDSVEWTAGVLTMSDQSITVHNVMGDQTYHLFDHITVSISVQNSHAHACSLKFTLLKNKPHMLLDEEGIVVTQKSDIIKEVHGSAAGEKNKTEKHVHHDFEELKSQYGQTPNSKSFYHIMQTIRDMAVLDT